MKTLFGLFSILCLFNAQAETSTQINYEGEFIQPTQTFVIGYREEKPCLTDGGEWDNKMETCFFSAANTVNVTAQGKGFFLEVSTIGSNAHMCGFEGQVTTILPNALVSKVATEVYDYETGDYIPATCEVTVTYKNSSVVSVQDNGKCREFCGMRAMLEMGPATRKE